LYSDAELAQIQAGLLMEMSVNQSEEVQAIKTSSLVDRAVAMVSKDGRENVVQASGHIRASLMAVLAYMFCAEQGFHQILMRKRASTSTVASSTRTITR
jgi:hypothetical protein